MKYAELHLHSLDRFDSQNDPEAVCRKLSEMGAMGLCLTQHGVLTGVEPMRKAAESYGLKFVPGCETYYGNDSDIKKNKHLILLSMDIQGYKAISKAVTDSNNQQGLSVMNDKILSKYFAENAEGHGHVIATSACISGVIASILRQNEDVEREIEKLRSRCSKYGISPDDTEYASLSDELLNLANQITIVTKERDVAKKISETKFLQREKHLQKLLDSDDPEYETELSRLISDKDAAKRSKLIFEQKKHEKASLLKRRSLLNKKYKAMQSAVEHYKKYQAEIEKLEEEILSPDQIYDLAVKETLKFKKVFGTDKDGEPCFYMEIQNHGIAKEAEIYPVLVKIAKDTGVPVVATNDVHIVENTDAERLRRQSLRAMRFEKDVWEEEQEGDDQLYIKTDEEMTASLKQIFPDDVVSEAMDNIKAIFDRCDVKFEKETHYPKFPVPDGKTADMLLDEKIEEGIRRLFPNGLDQAHLDRLGIETPIIKTMGFSDYLLIVRDFLEYGRLLGAVPKNQIDDAPLDIEECRQWIKDRGFKGGFSIGPGRGSAVGSLVCYLLGITSLDPLKYNLLFERFLNPERVTMPDIDSDLANDVRPKVIEYVKHKYGSDAVCGIITTDALAPKGCIRRAAKFLALKERKPATAYYGLGDTIAREVPNEQGTAFDTMIGETSLFETLLKRFKDDNHAIDIVRWAKLLEGSFTVYGAHAAGIVISDNTPVKEYVPLRWNSSLNEYTTQCDMQAVEAKGLLKMDFLGLKTLDIITGALRLIQKETGLQIDPLRIDLDDKNVYQTIFQNGNTNSVFQFESDGMKTMLKRFRPETFEDLIILVSMFRPGPIQFIDNVIEVKNGKEPTYVTDKLKPILAKTYGAIVYQEQVMEIFQKLAGYSLGGADQVRRFMSKKKMDKLSAEKEAFVNGDCNRNIAGCLKKGISREAAETLFEQMTDFARYAFNKSHAAAYAYNSYITAWLKYHYPIEFLCSAMNWAIKDQNRGKKIAGLIREAKSFGIKIQLPNINSSEADFSIKNRNIIYGLSCIKSVGSSGYEIIAERKNGSFKSVKDFFLRTDIRKNVTENLIKGGAFDTFCDNRHALSLKVDAFKKAKKKVIDKKNQLIEAEPTGKQYLIMKSSYSKILQDFSEIMIPVSVTEDHARRLLEEKQLLGAYVSEHPTEHYARPDDLGLPFIAEIDETTTSLIGVVSELEIRHRKMDGSDFASLIIEDASGEIDAIIFTKNYSRFKDLLVPGNVLRFYGSIKTAETSGGEQMYRFVITRVEIPPKKRQRFIMTVSSYAKFHATREEAFIRQYAVPEGGNELILSDLTRGQYRKMKYMVSSSVIEHPDVSILHLQTH